MSGDQPDLFGDEPAPAPVGCRSNIVIGTCSWTDPSLIKSKGFYPKGCSSAEARLRYYASQFPIVEVDSSFFCHAECGQLVAVGRAHARQLRVQREGIPPSHWPPDPGGVIPRGTWRRCCHPSRAGRRTTTTADTPEEVRDELWRRFIEALRPLKNAGKLLAVHFQFAPWATNSPDWRAHVEDCVARMAGHRVAVEFRNRSWFGAGHAEQDVAMAGGSGRLPRGGG